MRITGLYAALAALLVVFLAARVIAHRISSGVGVGDGGDNDLIRRVRVHANAVETLPIGLLLLLLVELNQTQPIVVHVFGTALILGRVLHAWGLSRHSGSSPGRAIGMALTLLAMLLMALLLIWQFALAATI